MVSIVLEAAQQMVDPGKTPRAFKLHDVSFLAAITLPEGMATEVILHMRPHNWLDPSSLVGVHSALSHGAYRPAAK